MTLSKETAQAIIDRHGISKDYNSVALTVNCQDCKGRKFEIIQHNNGHVYLSNPLQHEKLTLDI